MSRVVYSLWPSPAAGALLALAACAGTGTSPVAPPRTLESALFRATPLTDFRPNETYAGLEGGLYGNGSDSPSAAHHAAGRTAAGRVRPLRGRIVLLSIGMSNAEEEFRAFRQQVVGRGELITEDGVVLVNGAKGGATADEWDSPSSPAYDFVRDKRLEPAGVAESDVQVVWLKLAHKAAANLRRPLPTLPSPDADANRLADRCRDVIDAIRSRYPNVKQVFVSSRSYGGYATSFSPEPYAYESAFGVRSCILARDGRADPFVSWGPYLWAGETPRADGLVWLRQDFEADGIHPSNSGEAKVASLLSDFFETSPYTEWYR